jgi:hypothetical protein
LNKRKYLKDITITGTWQIFATDITTDNFLFHVINYDLMKIISEKFQMETTGGYEDGQVSHVCGITR